MFAHTHSHRDCISAQVRMGRTWVRCVQWWHTLKTSMIYITTEKMHHSLFICDETISVFVDCVAPPIGDSESLNLNATGYRIPLLISLSSYPIKISVLLKKIWIWGYYVLRFVVICNVNCHYSRIVSYRIVSYLIASCHVVSCRTVLYCIVLHHIVSFGKVWYGMVSYCMYDQ